MGMLSETLEKELRRYRIGERLRPLSMWKKLGLMELGRHTGLSPAILSKRETGRLNPTLPASGPVQASRPATVSGISTPPAHRAGPSGRPSR